MKTKELFSICILVFMLCDSPLLHGSISMNTHVLSDSIDNFVSSIQPLLPQKYEEYDSLLNERINLYDQQNDEIKKIELLEKVCKNLKNTFGVNSLQYCNVLEKLALAHYDNRNLNQALLYNEELVKVLTEYHPDSKSEIIAAKALYLNTKSSLDFNRNDYTLLDSITSHLHEISDTTVLGDCLYSVASTFYNIREYAKSIIFYEKCLAIDSIGTVESEYVLNDLNQLALAYIGIYDYKNAKKKCELAVEICSSNKKLSHLLTLAKTNLALCYQCNDDNEYAIKLYEEILPDIEKMFGRESHRYSVCIGNIGTSYHHLKNYEQSLKYLLESLSIHDKINGRSNVDVVDVLFFIARCYGEMNSYDEAIHYYNELKTVLEQIGLVSNTMYILTINNLAYCYEKNNNIPELEKCWDDFMNISPYAIFKELLNLSENKRFLIWDTFERLYSYKSIYYAMTLPNQHMRQLAYNSTLFSKSIILNSEIIQRKLQTDQKRFLSESDYEESLDILKHEKIQEKLGIQDIAIEFVETSLNEDSIIYNVLTLRNDYECPHLVTLFEKKQLDEIMKQEITDKPTMLSKLVWSPIMEELKNVKNIFFSPSGDLYKIGLENLPSPDGNGFMSDKYNMFRLSSTRELALDRANKGNMDAVVYGGIQYSADEANVSVLEANARLYASINRSDENLYNPYIDSLGVSRDDRKDPNKGRYLPSLPNAKVEANTVTKTINDAHIKDFTATVFTDTAATEASFKALSGQKKRLIHIATHGFYYKEADSLKYKGFMPQMFLDERNKHRYVEDKQLTRSGLYFAGADNRRLGKKIPDGVDDGILTAQEISMLDLRGCDLVVLSACQTAQGDLGADGVFGLQRAFKKAGVNSILMSIDKIDDRATQLLMTEFYKNYVKGVSKQESLKRAQKYLREETEYKDAKYWSSFILLDALD